MTDTAVKKVSSAQSLVAPIPGLRQERLDAALGERPPETDKASSRREYETIGYVIAGKVELELEGQKVVLEAGDSWVVPKGATPTYHVLEPFTAVEATAPPSHVHDRVDP